MTSLVTEGETLALLDEAAREERFARLQSRMPAVWESMRRDREGESVVIIPSVSLTRTTAGSGTKMQAFEERFLFLLLLLRQPHLRMVYVTSLPIDPRIVEYYLSLLPGVIPSHAHARLTLVSVGDASPRPLSDKLLERPRLLASIAALIPDRALSHLIPYNTTERERDVALSLGIPMYGADPRLAPLGSKTGCRRLFRETGVPFPLGAEGLDSVDGIIDAIEEMLDERPALRHAIVKLNEGVSGAGNALVDLGDLPASARRAEIEARVRALQPEDPAIDPETFLAAFATGGGVVEERIAGDAFASPSVQMRVLPGGTVELLSTHDQLLGGASGQRYLGCVFPADPGYSRLISEPAMVVGERLAAEGVLGRFAIDFVVVRDAGQWHAFAIELNLRKGGTTHPFLTLQFLTGGGYDGASGLFLTAGGDVRHLVATDHLESDALRALSIGDLFDTIVREGVQFDQARQEGIVFHMISSLTEHGQIGLTAVAASPERARELFDRAETVLHAEARTAQEQRPLPG